MALSKRTKEITVVALADKKAADELTAAIDAGAPTTPAAAVAAVASADADVTYGAEEQALVNETKAQLNAVIAALKAAGLMLP